MKNTFHIFIDENECLDLESYLISSFEIDGKNHIRLQVKNNKQRFVIKKKSYHLISIKENGKIIIKDFMDFGEIMTPIVNTHFFKTQNKALYIELETSEFSDCYEISGINFSF
jgi:hypothetical protein